MIAIIDKAYMRLRILLCLRGGAAKSQFYIKRLDSNGRMVRVVALPETVLQPGNALEFGEQSRAGRGARLRVTEWMHPPVQTGR